MRYLILGPLMVAHEKDLRPISSSKIRTLLASLLLHANQQMSVSQLIERMWDDEVPMSPRRVVQTNIVRLRHELPWQDAIVTTPGGYLARVQADQLDLTVFRRLLAEADAADNLEQEGNLLRRALQLWRGQACADVSSAMVQDFDIPPLTEARLLALDRRIEVDLLLNRLDGLVAELRRLTAEFPLRERFWVQLMAALYRQGRQAEALDAYRAVAHLLVHDLGIDPGVDLRSVHQQILNGQGQHELLSSRCVVTLRAASRPNGDDIGIIRGPQPTARDDSPVGVAPRGLPPDNPQFVGRVEELGVLDKINAELLSCSTPRVVVVDGPAGIGKTALAVRWCALNADMFPDGHLYVNLAGFGPTGPRSPHWALGVLLESLGLRSQDVPDDVIGRASLFRSRTAGRRYVVLLDNAGDSDQVRPLLPGGGCMTLVTSRNQLRALVARDGAERVTVSRLNLEESLSVLASIAGWGRVHIEGNLIRQLVQLCDHTPLALRILAERVARLPQSSVRQLVNELSHDASRLDAFDAFDGDLADLRTVLSWSYHHLHPDTLRVVRQLALSCDRTFSLVAAVRACNMAPPVVRRHLDRLVATNLLEQHGHVSYSLPRLVRDFALHLVVHPDECSEPVAPS